MCVSQTDHPVDTGGVGTQSVRVAAEQLGSLSGPDLLSWTADKYGEPLSYTRVSQPANHIDVTVDGMGVLRVS